MKLLSFDEFCCSMIIINAFKFMTSACEKR